MTHPQIDATTPDLLGFKSALEPDSSCVKRIFGEEKKRAVSNCYEKDI